MVVLKNEVAQKKVLSLGARDDGGAVPDGRKWYIAIVQTNCERRVREQLEKLGIEAFVPTQTDVRIYRGRRREVERVLLRSRVCVRVLPDRQSRAYVKKMMYVKSFVTTPGTYQDAVIPERQMDMFKYMLGCSDVAVSIVVDDIKVGRYVRVARGCFQGLEGNICEVGGKNSPCVGIHLDMLGYACVTINVSDLEFLE